MKKKKGIFIVIGVIIAVLVVVAGVIGYLVIGDLKQEELLKQEVVNVSNKNIFTDNYDIEVKTTGDYAYIEEAIKKYYKELSDNSKVISFYLEDEELTNILTPENLEKNRPNFTESYKLLTDATTKTTEAINNIANLCSEEKIKSLIDKDKVDEYYLDLYQDLMYTEKDLQDFQELKTEMETLSTNLNDFLSKVNEILNFLEKNNPSWVIENKQIYFDNDNLVNKYNKLYNELTTIANKIQDTNNNYDTNSDI